MDQCCHWRGNLREESEEGGRRGWREEKTGEVGREEEGRREREGGKER